MNTDRIEKKILLRAPLKRVWKAVTDYREFATWFGMTFNQPFKPGALMKGVIRPTKVNEEVAKLQKPHEGKPLEITIEKLEPERLFSFRWHPNAIDTSIDYSKEPTTLIQFVLEEVQGGVMLTVIESGFDRIPLERRATAFKSNDAGWGMVVKLLEAYVATNSQSAAR
jgi:uncharacterized protein YndB with AHSA1/START domain